MTEAAATAVVDLSGETAAQALRRQLIRNFDHVPLEPGRREPLYNSAGARLAAGTVAQRLGASVDIVAPGQRACPYHFHHADEEMFIVLEGHGTLRVAGQMLPLQAGDVVFVPPGPLYPHQIINTSDAPLKYLSISTNDAIDICEYPDSGKYAAYSSVGGGDFRALHRADSRLDYWDGEP